MATQGMIKGIYTDLTNALKSVIESKYIFLGARPTSTMNSSETMSKFIVVELPARFRDVAIGRKKFVMQTQGIMYLFTKAKSNATLNLNAASDFTDSVENLFPIIGECCSASEPQVLMDGADEYGYQIVTITFDIQTNVLAFTE